MSHVKRPLSLLLSLCLIGAISCSKKPGTGPDEPIKETQPKDESTPRRGVPATLDDVKLLKDFNAPSSMSVKLIDASPPDESATKGAARPTTTSLDASATRALLARMEELVKEEGDEVEFAKRAKSLPPPKTSETVRTAFPPASTLLAPSVSTLGDSEPLKVLRQAPEGEVELAPHISVTFNRPMVAITSHADTLASGVPVKVSPKVEGSWRWVGAKTLLFEAPERTRLPMATDYTVEIPAGTKSKDGKALGGAKSFTFSTPAPKLTAMWPQHGTFPREQAIFLGFDQEIDPEQMLESISLKSGRIFGGRTARLLTQAEVEQDDQLKAMSAAANPGTWMAITSSEPFAYDATVSVTVNKGAPSAEGARKTLQAQSFSFQTYGPLVVKQHTCNWSNVSCRPRDSFIFELSNALDTERFDASSIKIEPDFAAKNIYVSGSYIYINGLKPGRRTYKVTLPASTQDMFGQTLGEDKSFSFEVGIGDPALSSTGGQFMVLDPSSEPGYSVFSTNYATLRLQVYEVTHTDWAAYQTYYRDYNYYGKHEVVPPGKLLTNSVIKVGGEPDDLVETRIELSRYLGKDKLGNLVLVVTPESVVKGATMPKYKPRLRVWTQATELGLDAFVDGEQLLGWATSLQSGEPLDGVTLSMGKGLSKKSGADGLAKIELPTSTAGNHPYLLASKGSDVAFLPEQTWSSSSSWAKQPGHDALAWYVFDDRAMYRPGEEVHIKGWVRVRENRKGGDVRLPELNAKTLSYRVVGAQGNDMLKGSTTIQGLGSFDFSFKLPDTPNLGYTQVVMTIEGAGLHNTQSIHSFQLQEFRRPEFEVSASAEPGPYFEGEDALVSVTAGYYAGGALPNADTSWYVSTSAASFTPPNQQAYTFGSWVPWWMSWNAPSSLESTSESFQGKTDVTGQHNLSLQLGDISPPRPLSINASATVMDVNRQAWTSATTLLVHPSQHYVGMRSEKYFVKKGETLKVQLIATDVSGTQLGARPLKVRAARTDWTWKKGKYEEVFKDPQDCELLSKADAEVTCTFKTEVGGSYKITAVTVDDFGRDNFTQITRWVAGGKTPPARTVSQESVQMIPDRESYQPGDTAQILVQAPFTPAEGVLSLRRHGIIEERRFTMSEPTITLQVPIKEAHLPNLLVQVDLVGSAPRLNEQGEPDEKLPRRPAYAMGSLSLKIPASKRELDVQLVPLAEEMSPGESSSVEVLIKDAQGEPVKDAEVALVIVDESILALSAYAMRDPMAIFYAERPAGARDYHSRQSITLVDPSSLVTAATGGDELDDSTTERQFEQKPSPKASGSRSPNTPQMAPAQEMANDALGDGFLAGGLALADNKAAASPGGAASTPIAVRSNFNPLAGFSPAVTTDASGRATIAFTLPDNLTRYRVMAVAVQGGKKYGRAESAVTARLPLMIRPSPPRFLNFGDTFELPIVLQNQTKEPMQVQIATRSTNAELHSANGYSLTIPAKDRVEVRFPASAARAGTARFQVAASTKSFQDGTEFELPVWTPATSEAFATYGVIDKGAIAQPVKMPGEVWPQFGGLEITTSSTAMQALTDAFLYLYHYDYQCAEQISSRMLTVAALRDVLSAFKAEAMPSSAEIKVSMERDIEELVGRQNSDGGFGFWRRGQISWPFVSLHAAHALARAKEKGYAVPASSLTRAQRYLQDIESHIPGYYSEWTRRTIIAYALYVRGVMGQKDPAGARALMARAGSLDELSFETLGWLLGVMTGDAASSAQLAQLRRYLGNRVTETAGAAHYARDFDDGAYLIMHSDRRADGIILEGLIKDSPKSDLIPKLVKGLMAQRKRGRWSNTQENAFILLALDLYFATYEKQTPDFVARVWLGDTFAGQHTFKGRTTEEHLVEIPMSYLASADGEQQLVLLKDGEGRMYYRIGMNYAPKSLDIPAADQGFVVERVYEAVDDEADVKREADGTWVIKAGAKVKVRLTMVAPTRRYHVALVDPLPAGLEALNPALAVTGDLPQEQLNSGGFQGWWWRSTWYEHQNMRDERTEAFTTLLWGGVHSYTYFARATTPGHFVVPPAKAEEMYAPETFGRSATDRVKVVD